MSKHRRAPSAAVPPPARPARDAAIWGGFGCALVPVVLLWSGASWQVAFGIGGLVLLLAIGCGLALHFSGLTLHTVDHQDDERP